MHSFVKFVREVRKRMKQNKKVAQPVGFITSEITQLWVQIQLTSVTFVLTSTHFFPIIQVGLGPFL